MTSRDMTDDFSFSRNLKVGSVTPTLVTHATLSMSTWTIVGGAVTYKSGFGVYSERSGPSYPLVTSQQGFVSDEVASN